MLFRSLDKAVRGFAKTKKWPALSGEQTVMLYFGLSHGVDLTMALSTCTTGLFSTSANRDSEMVQSALNEARDYPGAAHTLRLYSEKRRTFGNDSMRN